MTTSGFDHDMERIAALTGFLSPAPRTGALAAVWLAALAAFSLWKPGRLSPSELLMVLAAASASGLGLAVPFTKALGGGISFAKALFLAVFDVFILALPLKAGVPAEAVLGVTFGVNVLVFATLAGLRSVRAAAPAAVAPFAAWLVWTWVSPSAAPSAAGSLAATVFAWLLCGAFFSIIALPMRRIGIDFMKLLAQVIGEYVNGPSSAGKGVFTAAGKDDLIALQTVVIDRSGVQDALVVPWVHPGPLGGLGGDIPDRIRNRLEGTFRNTLFLHTYVDHTRNPTEPDRVLALIAAAARRAAERNPGRGEATSFHRVRAGAATAFGAMIDGVYLVITTFAPGKTDDVAPEVGSKLLAAFDDRAVLVDGHNALGSGGETSRPIAEDDPRCRDLRSAVERLRETLGAEPLGPVQIGIAGRTMRAAGIRHCAALAVRSGLQTAAVVVLDANNLPPGIRDALLDAVASIGVEIAEVVTTDSHLADIPSEVAETWNGRGRAEILDSALAAVREAIADLRPARLRYGIERVPARVWGPLLDAIVPAVPETVRAAKLSGAALALLYSLVCGLGAALFR